MRAASAQRSRAEGSSAKPTTAAVGVAGLRSAACRRSCRVDSWEPSQEAPGSKSQSSRGQFRSWTNGVSSRSQTRHRCAGGSPSPVISIASTAPEASPRWRRARGGPRRGVPGEARGPVRGGPQRELGDDPYVRIRAERVDDVDRESGAGCQFLPALDALIGDEEPRPLRVARAFVEQGEGGVRLCRGVDVGGRQSAQVGELHRAFLAACRQRDRLRVAEVGAAGEVRGDVFVRDGDQPVDELGRQGGVAGETAQDVVDMVHRAHPARWAAGRPAVFVGPAHGRRHARCCCARCSCASARPVRTACRAPVVFRSITRPTVGTTRVDRPVCFPAALFTPPAPYRSRRPGRCGNCEMTQCSAHIRAKPDWFDKKDDAGIVARWTRGSDRPGSY